MKTGTCLTHRDAAPKAQPLDLPLVRQQLALTGGQSIWRSLEELSQTDAFLDSLHREFPRGASEWNNAHSRRSFLQLMGASMALAGVYGCSAKPDTKIVPYVNPPEYMVPGVPLHFASTHTLNGYARGILAESNEGRPTKIEGNSDHPANLGGTDVFMQASVLGLYDPERSHMPLRAGNPDSWSNFFSVLKTRLALKQGGAGVRVLSGTITSPTILSQIDAFKKRYPAAQWHVYEPAEQTLAGGEQPIYAFEKADVVLALDSDFLFGEPGSLVYARQFIRRRKVRENQKTMNRLYAAESSFTITGAMADHRLALRPSELQSLAGTIASMSAPTGKSGADVFIAAAIADLQAHRGSSLVVAGPYASPAVQTIARQMNEALGNVGKTVRYAPTQSVPSAGTISQLAADLKSGQVDSLLILDSNPAYTAPVDLDFAKTLTDFSNAKGADGSTYRNFSVHLGGYGGPNDETAFSCQWHLPMSHELESWGDARAYDGTASLMQPLIAPMYDSKSLLEVTLALTGDTDTGAYEAIRRFWSKQIGDTPFEPWWEGALKAGVIANSAPSASGAATTSTSTTTAPATAVAATTAPASSGEGLEVVFRPDYTIWDGRYANNGWLQELPKPLTKITWDNAALLGFKTAHDAGVTDGDVVKLTLDGREILAAVAVLPGIPDNTVTLTLGYGREHVGSTGYDADNAAVRGYNAYALRTSATMWSAPGLKMEITSKTRQLATTRSHHAMDTILMPEGRTEAPNVLADPAHNHDELETTNRRLVRTATLEDYRKNNEIIRDLGGESEKRKITLSLYPDSWDYTKAPHKWGMSIDMQSCIGCNACVTACQAENNIPIVGKEQVANQREMHWIRIDSYFSGTLESPAVYNQPVPCQHCENAPCELVCPVGATSHSAEGVNEMTYNRCVGTRYCSNNCPYKVRRFNFFNYESDDPTLAMQRNPEVTVRGRGVMEKCTYCIQRITRTRIDIEKITVQLEERAKNAATPEESDKISASIIDQQQAILDDLQTACQQACPTEAIIFGDLNDVKSSGGKGSYVLQLKAEPTDYGILTELTTKPRTTYMARLSNPNPAITPAGPGKLGGEA